MATSSLIFMAAVAQVNAATLPAALPTPFSKALATFEQICVAPLPDSRAFISAKNASGLGWVEEPRKREVVEISGYGWVSTVGRLDYVKRQQDRFTWFNPSCHLSFLTDGNFTEEAAVAEISKRFGTAVRYEPKIEMSWCWETTVGAQIPVRVYLNRSEAFFDQKAARLSIARRWEVDEDFKEYMQTRGGLKALECKAGPPAKRKK